MFKFIPTQIDSFINAEGPSTMQSLNFAYDLEFALYICHSVCSSASMGTVNQRSEIPHDLQLIEIWPLGDFGIRRDSWVQGTTWLLDTKG